ncbi:MAG: trypsin-like peptidase domain-containing protein [Akkermansiaceae bacterium]|nr:trypsin-like peptidase domain-containing protein [Akkermansiaceae bacterium]
MNAGFRRLLALATVFALAFLAVFAMRVCQDGGSIRSLLPGTHPDSGAFRPETFTLAELPPLDLKDTELLNRLNNEYAKLTEAVVPSVISIDTVGTRTERLMDGWGRSRIRRYPTQGQGSGVIVSKQGHAITNHHVIAGQQQIQVTLHNGKTYPATLVGEDSLLDIAVLKIEGDQPFAPLPLGDSSQVRVGQLVLAVGNPFGLGETVTQGIISAKERSLSDNQRDLFQTDAAINPGNSGGPLVNLRGEIIGINAAIYSKDRENPGFQGVGFSIPSNDVKEALTQILERGRPIRGFLGVQMRDLDPTVRAAINYEGTLGSVVMGTTAASPAEHAGLRTWDVVLKFDGQPIKSTDQLISLVQRSKADKTVPIEIWRRGQMITLKATIIESASSQAAAVAATAGRPQGRTRDAEEVLQALGIVARDLSMTEILRNFRGAVITQVGKTALADGIVEPGDLVVAVNQSPINNSNELYIHLAASAAVQATSLQIIRNGRPLRVNLPGLPREE